MRKAFNKWASNTIRRQRGTLSTPWQRAVGWFELYFVDHAFFRSIYLNRHYVTPDFLRSAQPSPGHIKKLARDGVKTIINLRGERNCSSYLWEKQWCEELGITLINFQVRSRDVPQKQVIQDAKDLFDRVEKPVLVHCKSGADRAGFMAALYLVLEGRSVEEALKQLSPAYGHIRQGKTGILDYFFETYEVHRQETGEDFLTWIKGPYDSKATRAAFKSSWWANVLVDRILRRE